MRRTLAVLLLTLGICSRAAAQIDVNKLIWSSCGSCPQSAEVVAAGPVVTVGVAGRGQSDQQNMAYHMAATLLPPASSYTVTFQYNLSTWDSYNAPGTPNPPFNGGTGYWDSFSVSISSQPYWQLPLTDPITTTELPGIGFLWGGSSYGGNNPAQQNSGQTTITINGNPNGSNYLNVGLDTATLPEADTNFPSWGTFTIISIIPTCTGDIADISGVPPFYQCGKPFKTPAAGQPGAWWAQVYDHGATHAISSASNGSPTVLTSANHGLSSGSLITILNATGNWSAINGSAKASVVDANRFSIPVNSNNFGALSGSPIFTQDTICRWGCALTSVSMVLNFYGVPYDPGTLNTALNSLGANGYDSSGNVMWSAVKFLSGGAIKYLPGDGSTNQVDADLCQGRPVILGVNGNTHWVVAIGKTGGQYDILDPGHISVNSLSFYGNTFSSSRRFIPPGSGAFVIYADALVQVLVTDPAGRRVGFSNGVVYREMPGSNYFDEQISSDDTDDPSGTLPLTHILFIPEPGDGFYQLQITGQQQGAGSVRIYRYNKQDLPLTVRKVSTSLVPGQVLTQTITYSTKIGDVNGDGFVDATDLAIVQAALGTKLGDPGYNPAADLNGDGVVDALDLEIVQSSTLPALTTTALALPQPNAGGWNDSDVTVTLKTSGKAPGPGIKEITYSTTGAQAIPSTVANGGSASFTVSAEGITTVTFFATDKAGNVETAKTFTIQLDKTPPTITGLRTPLPNANGWNNTNVSVSFQCADALSGLAAGSPPSGTTLSSEGAGQSVIGTCTDVAGNSASATVSNINIDKTPPAVACSASPNVLWPPNNKLVPINISVNVSDPLSGPGGFTLVSVTSNEPDSGQGDIQGFVIGTASTSGQLRAQRLGSGRGRVYTLTYSGSDRAGNTTSCSTTVTVPHDQGN